MAIAKDITTPDTVHTKMLAGVKKLADVVGATLGPKGRFVVIEATTGMPHVTKDGYTVAKCVLLEDSVENIGAELVKQAAIKQNEISGDGTTTTTVLAASLYEAAVGMIETGVSPNAICEELDTILSVVEKYIEDTKADATPEDFYNIAFVSSNGDDVLSQRVADAWSKVGADGYVSAVAGKGLKTETIINRGFVVDGYCPNPLFLTNPEKGLAEYQDALIVLLDCDNFSLGDLSEVSKYWAEVNDSMMAAGKDQKPIIFVARTIKENLLAMFFKNRKDFGLPVLPILTGMSSDMFDDLGRYLDCQVFTSREMDIAGAASNSFLFGSADVSYKAGRLSIIPKKEPTKGLEERIAMVRDLVETTKGNPEENTKYLQRLGKLTGGVAFMLVGGQTDAEIKETKDRYDDAIHAVRAGIRGGVLPGGGLPLSQIASNVSKTGKVSGELAYAVMGPLFKLYDNAEEACLVAASHVSPFNIRTGQFDDTLIDPAQVVHDAFKDAVSVVKTLVRVSHTITLNNEAVGEFKNQLKQIQQSVLS